MSSVSSRDATRAVLRAAYRLLRAMASGFPQMQTDLLPHVPTFLAHVDADLVSRDISPTEPGDETYPVALSDGLLSLIEQVTARAS